MKKSARKNKENKARIIRIIDGLLSVATLLFLFGGVLMVDSNESAAYSYLIVFSLLAMSYLLNALSTFKTDTLTFVKNIFFTAIFLSAGATVYIMGVCTVSVIVMIEAFLITLLTNRILAAITKQKIRYRVLNILLALFIAFNVCAIVTVSDISVMDLVMILIFLIGAKVLGHIIAISFSQMRFSVLRKIMRKTFAAEILFGLILLILSFSFVFQSFESGIKSYFDALWYCFAVVTTIGFGDYTVVSPISRVLSVILGVYGLVVVATITSVIVNFYNEVKDDKTDDPDESEEEKTTAALAEASGDEKEAGAVRKDV